MSIDREALRRVAEAATPGPWRLSKPDAAPDDPAVVTSRGGWWVMGSTDESNDNPADADFIAAFDPTTVLALLDALDAAEGEAAEAVACLEERDQMIDHLTAAANAAEARAGRLREALVAYRTDRWVNERAQRMAAAAVAADDEARA